MTLYLTKSMLSKLNTVKYACNSATEDDGNSGNSNDHWQKIYLKSDRGVELAKDMICRVCARSGNTPLLTKLTEDYDVLSAIRTISNLSVSVNDSLPKYICTECLEMLRISLKFKRTCETSDRKFRNILNPMGDPSMHSYPYSKHDFHLILHQMKLKRMKIEEKKERQRQRVEKMFKKKSGPKEKQFKCSPCDMTFPDKDKLAQHRRERQCMRRACDICGQLVLSISQHRRHIHKQSQPHKCPTCGKEFPIIARLKTHMLVHTNTFNFFCDICPYKCKHKYYLVMHMRTHTGEKPYKCAQCPATFVNPSNLNKHKLTHQEKQIKCALCDKAFRTNPALREHHEAAHMNIKHTCNYCGRDFCYKSDLRKHEIRSHNRTKRDYIGGEPSYKQVERLKLQDNIEEEKWSMATTLTHARPKHDYMDDVGEETSERVHKLQDNTEEEQKWRQQHLVVTSHVPQTATLAQQFTVDDGKEYIYFSDVTGLIQQQPQLVQQQTQQQQTVAILPELLVKKDEVKLYEPQQGIGYF